MRAAGALLLFLACNAPGAATAGQGWYLLAPPTTEAKSPGYAFRSDATRPLAEWGQRSAFDTAKECEAALAEERRKYPLRTTGTPVEMSMGAHIALSRCVASDDPRLGEGR
jgi:hypothetical protein